MRRIKLFNGDKAPLIKLFNGDKAQGPDGFPMAFFQNCWDLIRFDIMGVMHSFHERAAFATSLNASFLTLIPKKTEVVEVKDFKNSGMEKAVLFQ